MPATAHVDILCNILYYINDFLVVTKLQTFLREVAKAHRFANVKTSAVKGFQSQQQFDEGALASAVIAYNAHLFIACKVVVEIF